METGQIVELARTVAALPQDEQDFFDGLVADERARAADEARIAELRSLGGYAVVRVILGECAEHAASYDPAKALRRIEEAGFVRLTGPVMNAADENRWEVGIRNIVHHLHGPRHEFEIYDIVDEVRELAEGRDRNAKVDLPEAVTRIREVVTEIEGLARRGRPIENGPSLKHWLLRGLDALTGENHSGWATSLPAPKKGLV